GQEYWAATVLDNGGTNRAISEQLMQQAFDAPAENSAGEVSLVIGGFGVRRAYQGLLTSLKRYVNTMQLEGGFSALEYNGKPFTVDKDCPPNRIFFLDESHLALYELAPPDWMQQDGKILKWDGNVGYKAVYEYFCNLGTDLRGAHAVLADITEQ
ncbi:MAG TPA: phage major capsid protein, partial [Trueperaceae bacterium]